MARDNENTSTNSGGTTIRSSDGGVEVTVAEGETLIFNDKVTVDGDLTIK